MEMLIDGEWRDVWYDTTATGGRRAERDEALGFGVTGAGIAVTTYYAAAVRAR
jgi:hypothetical protein